MMMTSTQIISRYEFFDPNFMIQYASKSTPLGAYSTARVDEWRSIVGGLGLSQEQMQQ